MPPENRECEMVRQSQQQHFVYEPRPIKKKKKLKMLFNFGKCKCLHTGPGNTGMNYEMGGTILSKTVKEKDLGVSMNANMKVSEKCRIAASRVTRFLE